MKRLLKRISLSYTPERLAWVIIFVGFVLRLAQYLANRSLWFDESIYALNIIGRSYGELLVSSEGAPVGFLMLEKLVGQAFGNSEFALRLLPFLAGIFSLFAFYEVAKRFIAPNAVLIALGLFAILDPLIYFSSEVKHYSSDVATTLLIYLATVTFMSRGLSASSVALFGVVGAAVLWFSHSSLFVLAGVGVSLGSIYLTNREWAKTRRLSIVCSLWALSFAVCYLVSLRHLSANKHLTYYWAKQNAFMPFPPLSFSDLAWFSGTFFEIFNYPVALRLAGIGALTFLVGCASLFKKEIFPILISPALVALLASGLHKYPFKDRLLLFIVPSLLLLISEGAEYVRARTRSNSPIVGVTLIGLLFFHPLVLAKDGLLRARTRQETRPVIGYVRDHKQDGDTVYLYFNSKYAFKYYAASHGFNENDYIVGAGPGGAWDNYEDWDRLRNCINDLDRLRGKMRVWILFSHSHNDESFFLYHLDNMGKRLDSFKTAGASVYLYDLSEEASTTESEQQSPISVMYDSENIRSGSLMASVRTSTYCKSC